MDLCQVCSNYASLRKRLRITYWTFTKFVQIMAVAKMLRYVGGNVGGGGGGGGEGWSQVIH